MDVLWGVYFYGSAWLVLLIFCFAAFHKLHGRNEFLSALAGYRLLLRAALLFWWLLPISELLAVIELLLSAGQSRWLALSLLLIYGMAIFINLLRGRRDIDCGCGGDGTPIGWGLVVRNLVLAGLALPQPSPPQDLMFSGIALTFVAVLFAFLGYGIANQLYANSARG